MKRKLNGEQLRNQVLFYIEDHPGLTSYEIGNKLGWSSGKIYYYIKQLINSGEVKVDRVSGNPHKKKLLYAVSWDEMIDWDQMEHIKKP